MIDPLRRFKVAGCRGYTACVRATEGVCSHHGEVERETWRCLAFFHEGQFFAEATTSSTYMRQKFESSHESVSESQNSPYIHHAQQRVLSSLKVRWLKSCASMIDVPLSLLGTSLDQGVSLLLAFNERSPERSYVHLHEGHLGSGGRGGGGGAWASEWEHDTLGETFFKC